MAGKPEDSQDLWVAAAALAVAALVLFWAVPNHTGRGYGRPGALPPGFMPNVAAIGIGVCAAVLGVNALRRRAARAPGWRITDRPREVLAALGVFLAAIVVFPWSAMAALAIIGAGAMVVLGERRWRAIGAMGVLLPLAIHLVFERGFRSSLPGLLG